MTKLVFIDTETTNLNLETAEPWEIGLIVRDSATDPGQINARSLVKTNDVEWLWQLTPEHLELADPQALTIGRYTERKVRSKLGAAAHGSNGQAVNSPIGSDFMSAYIDCTPADVADQLFGVLDGAVLIGSNVGAYDWHVLKEFMYRWGYPWTPFYRPIDVVDLAVGYLYGAQTPGGPIEPPYRSSAVMEAFGLPKKGDQHTALGDCRWARDAYDKVFNA